jgi:hypothetical protein
MAGSAAENFKKSADRFLGIPENVRHSPEPVLANPRIIITNSVGGFANPAPVQEKERLSCWEFQKKCGSIFENSGKRLARFLSISKKERINS